MIRLKNEYSLVAPRPRRLLLAIVAAVGQWSFLLVAVLVVVIVSFQTRIACSSSPAFSRGAVERSVCVVAATVVIVVASDMRRKSSSEGSLQVESLGDILIVEYILHYRNLLHASLSCDTIMISELINANNFAQDSW